MPGHKVSMLGSTESHSMFVLQRTSVARSAFRPCLARPAQRKRQIAPAVCEAQQDRAEGLGRKIAAAAASISLLFSSGGSALADVPAGAADMSNATVGASAGVNTVLGEQNQALQRASDQAKREVDRKAPLSAQRSTEWLLTSCLVASQGLPCAGG